jgi:N6-L-threonylcarbamoyladenine synthase
MKILAIETSCDETAVCLVECTGDVAQGDFEMKVLANALHSQIDMHKEFGGVVPMMAKREHAKNLIPLFLKVLEESNLSCHSRDDGNPELKSHKLDLRIREDDKIKYIVKELNEIFGRENEFKNEFVNKILSMVPIDSIDAIAVTEGPGLEPALWMGIIFAKALGITLNIPVIPVNHMEGHVISALPELVEGKNSLRIYQIKKKVNFPIISLLISGGHTELILIKEWHSYELIGRTRDDAVGEAYDKVARMLGLPYPGGPEIYKLAQNLRCRTSQIERKGSSTKTSTPAYILPRPMINSNDYDFSFSGLKTAVLYSLRNENPEKEIVSKEFEDAVTEVLISKTIKAVEEFNAKTLILGGGVVSNNHIRSEFQKKIDSMPEVKLLIPEKDLRTDNALMIALTGSIKIKRNFPISAINARGNLRLT